MKKLLLILTLVTAATWFSPKQSEAIEPSRLTVRLNGVQGVEEMGCAQKINDAIQLIEAVINSDEFKQEILDHEWNGKKQFAQADGLSNEEIYQKIIEGFETTDESESPTLGTLDLSLQVYRPFFRWSKVIGYTRPNENTIYLNRYRLRDNSTAEVAANLVHEWTHKLGFDHDSKATSRRAYSVPYRVGDLFLKIAKNADF